jgi:hypothetical protein
MKISLIVRLSGSSQSRAVPRTAAKLFPGSVSTSVDLISPCNKDLQVLAEQTQQSVEFDLLFPIQAA